MVHTLLEDLKEQQIQLIAVSKRKPEADILEFYHMGHRAFGENRVQELVDKQESLPKDIEWHMIGHLQTNKVKYIAPFVHLIHSFDSIRLIKEVNKQGERLGQVIPGLLQFKIAEEDSKYGFAQEEAIAFLDSADFQNLKFVEVHGVMGMATFTDDEAQVRGEFKRLKHIFDTLKATHFSGKPYFKEVSMGMSGDYNIAIAEGSTMVRIGSLLFGPR
ncbi:MAG: YggS family pyridoxal phosphate-dependent enzyme [Bacteroidota bacterium]